MNFLENLNHAHCVKAVKLYHLIESFGSGAFYDVASDSLQIFSDLGYLEESRCRCSKRCAFGRRTRVKKWKSQKALQNGIILSYLAIDLSDGFKSIIIFNFLWIWRLSLGFDARYLANTRISASHKIWSIELFVHCICHISYEERH